MKASAPTELQIQASLRQWLYYAAPTVHLVAVPNAAKRSPWAARQVKQEGLAKGFCDLIAFAPGGKIAFLEMKSAKGRVSPDQSEWLLRLNQMGFHAAVCRSAEEAVAFLARLGFPIRERAS